MNYGKREEEIYSLKIVRYDKDNVENNTDFNSNRSSINQTK